MVNRPRFAEYADRITEEVIRVDCSVDFKILLPVTELKNKRRKRKQIEHNFLLNTEPTSFQFTELETEIPGRNENKS